MQSSPSSFPSSFFTIHLLSCLSFYWLSTWFFFTSISCIHGHTWILKQAFVSSVQFSRSVVSNSSRPHGLQHTRLLCPSLCPGICSNLSLMSQWCCPTISSSVTRLSSCPQSSPASGSFPMSWLFASGGQSVGASASDQSFQWMFRIDFL